MKKVTLQLAVYFYATTLIAQWVPINNGLNGFPPTALWPSGDALTMGTYGGGVYITYDQGDIWVDFNGDLPNLFVNDIRTHLGLLVATEGGPFATYDGTTYFDCTGTGLTNTDINFFTFGNEGITGEFMVGTDGGGVFAGDHTSPWILDWTPASTGLSGAGLTVNDGAGITGGWAMIATDGGVYRALPGETEWTPVNNGLSGDAQKVRKFGGFGGNSMLIATHGGLYSTSNIGDNWAPMIADEKLNTVLIHMSAIYPNGAMVYTFGEKGFYSDDFVNWTQMDFEGIEGEVTAAQVDSVNLYLGFTVTRKNSADEGAVYRKPIQQVVAIEENLSAPEETILYQNFPNPVSDNANITFTLSRPGIITLTVFNITGEKIQTLISSYHNTGTHTISFDVNQYAKGIYFYSLQIDGHIIETKRMVIVH